MADILEYIIKYAEANHWPQWVIEYIILWVIPIMLLGILIKFIYLALKKYWNYRNTKILNNNIGENFRNKDVYNYTHYYVQTRYQNVSPSEDDEPGRNYIVSAKGKLMKVFLKKVFNTKLDNEKYFLILADSGMGKTTFLVNLLIKYKNRIQFPWYLPKSKINLIALGASNAHEQIDAIIDKENTILLLDAFDEDSLASLDYSNRLNYLLAITKSFKIIIITCRSQFFPSEKEEPFHTGYYTFGEKGEYKFQKIHLSTFNNLEILQYLFKRYNIINPFKLIKFIKAYGIVKKCHYLMMRPMLLSYIDDLLNSKKEYFYSYQIYEDLIFKWILRESNKVAIIKKYKSAENYQEKLYEFLKKLSIVLSQKDGNSIYKDEPFGIEGLSLSDYEEDYKIAENEIKSKSLLNRTSNGYYKFSHKSILEFFLASQLIENKIKEDDIDLAKFDTANTFYQQMMIQSSFKSYDGYYTLENDVPKLFQSIEPHEMTKIKSAFIKHLSDTDPKFFKFLPQLKQLYVSNYSLDNLYFIYARYLSLTIDYARSSKLSTDQMQKLNEKRDQVFYFSNKPVFANYPALKKRLEDLENYCIVIEPFLVGTNFPEFKSHLKSISGQIELAEQQWVGISHILKQKKIDLEGQYDFDTLSYDNINLKKINSFLLEIDTLKKTFSGLEIIY